MTVIPSILRFRVRGPEAAVVGEEALVCGVQLDAFGPFTRPLFDFGHERFFIHHRVEADEGDEAWVLAGDLAGPGVAPLHAAQHLAHNLLLHCSQLVGRQVGRLLV